MRKSFEYAIKGAENESCEILLEAGLNPSHDRWVWDCAIQQQNAPVCRLLVQYGADPFMEEQGDENDVNATSPFLAAARLSDITIFEFFLDLWDERFSSTGGKNGDGDYPLHVVCCDPHVSLQAIELLVNRQADVLAVVDGEQGLLPFHFAANWGASLDVIFYLLQHCPDALRHVGNTATSSTGAAGQVQNDLDSSGPPQKKAKTTHSTC
jgi:hypothetical protein